jgi:hypothetical protein
MKQGKQIVFYVIAVYLCFNLFNTFFVYTNWALPMYVGYNFLAIEDASRKAASCGTHFGKAEVASIVSNQDWNQGPWPYVATVTGSETNWTVICRPKKRPLVILRDAILFWDTHHLRHPTEILNSDLVEETIYPGGLTFRDGKRISPNKMPEDTVRKLADPQH